MVMETRTITNDELVELFKKYRKEVFKQKLVPEFELLSSPRQLDNDNYEIDVEFPTELIRNLAYVDEFESVRLEIDFCELCAFVQKNNYHKEIFDYSNHEGEHQQQEVEYIPSDVVSSNAYEIIEMYLKEEKHI